MTADRLLRTLAALAIAQAASAAPGQARRASRAYVLLGALRAAAITDPAVASTVSRTLQAVGLLSRPLAGARRSLRARPSGIAREDERRFSDAELVKTLRSCASVKDAARRLGVDRKTISRRVGCLMGHLGHDVPLRELPSLRRSMSRRRTK